MSLHACSTLQEAHISCQDTSQFRLFCEPTTCCRAILIITSIIPITACCTVDAISTRIHLPCSVAYWKICGQTVEDSAAFSQPWLTRDWEWPAVEADPCITAYVRLEVDIWGIHTWRMTPSGWQWDVGRLKEDGSVFRRRWRLWMGGNNCVRGLDLLTEKVKKLARRFWAGL